MGRQSPGPTWRNPVMCSVVRGGYLDVVRGTVRWAGVAVTVCVLLAGCSDDDRTTAADDGSKGSDATPRCRSPTTAPTAADRGGCQVTVLDWRRHDPAGGRLRVSSRPSGTVLVLLHQTGMLGLCGWATFAPAGGRRRHVVGRHRHVRLRRGAVRRREATPPEDQVALAVAHARDELDAEKVVLVGASMGGSQTVHRRGPRRRGGRPGSTCPVRRSGRGRPSWTWPRTCRPVACRGLVAHAPDDDAQQYAAAQALAPAAGAEFLDAQSGHGWTLLERQPGHAAPGRPGAHRLRELGRRLASQAPAVSRLE